MFLTTGAIYKGGFKNDEFWGKGKIKYPDGTKLTARFTCSNIPKVVKIYFPDY